VALSPVLVIGGIRWSGDIERDAERRQETMSLLAQEAGSRAEYLLSSAPELLQVISATAPADPCAVSLNRLSEALPEQATLSVADASGKIRCSTSPTGPGVDIANREWFKQLRDDGKAVAQSTAYYAEVSKRWVIATGRRRTKEDGSFDGAFVLGVPIESLVRQLEEDNLEKDSEIALLDTTGQVFASENCSKLGPEVMGKLDADQGGFFTVKSGTGEERELSIVPLAGNDFYALLSAPKPPPIALENVSAFGNFALPLLAWLLALVTAWLATDRLVLRWLDYLRRIAGLYASGKLSVQPLRARRAAPGEINVLADSMEEMAARVRERTQSLEAAVEARDAAMKEIHHRVKNNLQIINSLLSLQSRKVKDPAAVAVLDDARARINALSLIHRSLYEHNDIRSVDVKSFLSELAAHLDQALGAEDQRIRIESDIDNDTIDADVAVPLALFTAEAVTNSVKHAFPEDHGVIGSRVIVTYRVDGEETTLTVEDNGIGGEQAAAAASTGIGGTLMAAFAKQVHGVLEEAPSKKGGRAIRIRIPRINGVTGAHPHAAG
jgi:two-component sensor histidine kinase